MASISRRNRPRKRTAKRLVEKEQRKIQKAMTNDLLDSVLTSLSYQDISNKTDTMSFNPRANTENHLDSPAAEDAQYSNIDNLPLQQLHASLFPRDLPQRIQLILDQCCEKRPASADECKKLTVQLNQIINGAKLTLKYHPTNVPIRLRVISPARSGKAYFQLRTANAKQQAVYTGIKFPALTVC
jgi:hypothetical protein